MYIVLQSYGDPMLVDDAAGLRAISSAVSAFVASSDRVLEFAATSPCPYWPDERTLPRLRFIKTDGRLRTTIHADRVEVCGRPELLARYAECFETTEEQGHAHPENALAMTDDLEQGSDAIIVEPVEPDDG